MITRMWILWTCTVIFLLVRECHCIQKTTLSKNWGPQSMLYLKGKHGRRFVPDIDDIISSSGLKSWVSETEVAECKKTIRVVHNAELCYPLMEVKG
ncbi:spexin prohormone 2-like isoform X2 [Labeo rohita]|uniref:spexin prohormone 2-like isoform X2 n=1 Tax=Labeo rohita TaxID=84645 RepID=UPI0021E32778|nr:spexin prohormone 2-like isoform X2 [Labeo rohita]